MFYAIAFQIAWEYAIRRVQVNQEGLKLNGKHQLLVYADVNKLGRNVHLIKKNTEALVAASNKTAQEENIDKTRYR